MDLLSQDNLAKAIDYKFGIKNLLATFHPVTTDVEGSLAHLQALFTALDSYPDIHVLFTMPNADEGGLHLLDAIENYAAHNSDRVTFIKSLGFRNYLSALQYVDGVIGNSSSGILEAPSFKIGTINIGSRQNGRTRAKSIIDCEADVQSIEDAIKNLYADDFQKLLETVENPFTQDDTSSQITDILKSTPLKDLQYKVFYDQKGLQ